MLSYVYQLITLWLIPDIDMLNSELLIWHTQRNKDQKGVDWQFATDTARDKL